MIELTLYPIHAQAILEYLRTRSITDTKDFDALDELEDILDDAITSFYETGKYLNDY